MMLVLNEREEESGREYWWKRERESRKRELTFRFDKSRFSLSPLGPLGSLLPAPP